MSSVSTGFDVSALSWLPAIAIAVGYGALILRTLLGYRYAALLTAVLAWFLVPVSLIWLNNVLGNPYASMLEPILAIVGFSLFAAAATYLAARPQRASVRELGVSAASAVVVLFIAHAVSEAGFVVRAPGATPTAAPRAEVETTQVVLKTWLAEGGATAFELIVEVRNPTGDYIAIGADLMSPSSYDIRSKDGAFMIGGVLDGPYPPVIAPGAKGYLFDAHALHPGETAENVGRAAPDIYATVAGGPVDLLRVSDLRLVPAIAGDGLEVAGVVTNSSSRTASGLTVASVFFDSEGKLIGGVCGLANGLAPRAAGEFLTDYRGAPPLKASEVARYEAWAFDADLGSCLEVLVRD